MPKRTHTRAKLVRASESLSHARTYVRLALREESKYYKDARKLAYYVELARAEVADAQSTLKEIDVK